MNTLRIDSISEHQPGCLTHPEIFQDPLLEDPADTRRDRADHHAVAILTNRARALCAGCPRIAQCLHDAVVKHDVSGFVAGTTEPKRRSIRLHLGVTVEPEDFDSLAGSLRSGRRIDHDEVIRLRQANPHESLEVLARRIGCSLSTIKRHLRRHRLADSLPSGAAAIPSHDDVLEAAGFDRDADEAVA